MKSFITLVVSMAWFITSHGQTSSTTILTGHASLIDGKPAPATVMIVFAREKSRQEEGVPFNHRHPPYPAPVRADNQGRFQIESLDPAWLYHVVVIAPGCRPQIFDPVDPVAGPLEVHLKPVNPAEATGAVLHGEVMDDRGNPILGAVIKIGGITRDNTMQWPANNIDFYAVSDKSGKFVVQGSVAFTAAEGSVEAAGFAISLFEGWAPGDTIHTVTLSKGAALAGRLQHAGNPVPKIEVRLDNFGAESGSSVWHYSTHTDSQGRFSFTHLPPNRSCSLYATMESLGERGSLSKQRLRILEAGSTNDIGDLNLQPSFKVEGQIHLSDEKPMPSGAKLMLVRASMAGTQDELFQALDPKGAFSFVGVPAEKASIYLRIPGYELTPKDRFLIGGSATNFVVANNISDMVIQMHPHK